MSSEKMCQNSSTAPIAYISPLAMVSDCFETYVVPTSPTMAKSKDISTHSENRQLPSRTNLVTQPIDQDESPDQLGGFLE